MATEEPVPKSEVDNESDKTDSDVESLVDVGEELTKAADQLNYVETLEIGENAELNKALVDSFHCYYTDVINEFADVEIFLISLDSLLCEFTAHKYNNWVLGGQTIVLSHQVRSFFERLNDLNAKYKLVWFTDLEHKYASDSVLNFIYNYLIAFLDSSEYAQHIERFSSPVDPEWDAFLKRLTPSFLLMSIENPSLEVVRDEINFVPEFASIAVQLITVGIPVIYFEAFAINFSSVLAYRIKVSPVVVFNFEERLTNMWNKTAEKRIHSLSAGECKNAVDFLTLVLKKELQKERNPEFEKFCLSVLLAAFIGQTVGYKRYLPNTEAPKVSDIVVTQCRRRIYAALTEALKTLDVKTVKFVLDDIWDGRLILFIFASAINNKPILPYRLQLEFAKAHEKVGFKEALATDENDTLLIPPEDDVEGPLSINGCGIYSVKNEFVDAIFDDKEVLKKFDYKPEEQTDFESIFRSAFKWRFLPVEDRLLQLEPKVQLTAFEIKKLNRSRQRQSKWLQAFSDSLEGRGNDLLVDFSRVPRLPVLEEEEKKNGEDDKKGKKGAGGKGKNEKKGAKTPKLSKKDQILEANKLVMIKKQVESDKVKIQYATKVKTNAIQALENVKRKLQLDESKAICAFELVLRYADVFYAKANKCQTIEEKRQAAVELVGQIKECFVTHWNFLDQTQQGKIEDIWIQLGFYKHPKKKASREYDLDIDVIYYQLYHGGRLIDVLTDSQHDERVVGFKPDAWQRRMLNVVDKNESALIVAPTSAGKTFVSYYCIEKVLRQSNEDVVVYVSPSKALTNQVCGSVYARFRNKPLHGNTVLFGTILNEYSENALNCQVLITIPQCLEEMLLSPDPQIQQFVARIKYVILDEVHCINTAGQGHIWEHIFLLINAPFLALSATISNVDVFHKWLQGAENSKAVKGEAPRNVNLIVYKERWSELELAIQKMEDCPDDIDFTRDVELFNKGFSLADMNKKDDSANGSLVDLNKSIKSVLKYFMPYSVYKPEKIRMFSIPDDQQLTARQIVELYVIMAEVDGKVKAEFEPSKFFGYKSGSLECVWLNRTQLRNFETQLKQRFLDWLHNDQEKIEKVFSKLESDVKEEFDKRMKPFNMFRAALHNVVPLLDQLKTDDMLPSICFNDNREFCEQLAIHSFNELEVREMRYMNTAEFKKKFNFKAEDRMAKLAKRKRDVKDEDKKKGGPPEDEPPESMEESDVFALQRIKLKELLAQFKFQGRVSDEELYDKTVERLNQKSGNRPSTKTLLKLFERGIAFHHEGLNAQERGAVEILFRAGFVGILFSTSTLALGMNMPCKTVVFGIDTPQLSPLQFRQMSGRAGRRGYDAAGTVIFMALPTSKIRRLLTASLATLRGNVPYTTSFLLRLFAYVNGVKEEFTTRDEILVAFKNKTVSEKVATTLLEKLKLKEANKKKGIQEDETVQKQGRIQAALTLLKNSFALYTRHEKKAGVLKEVLQGLTFFNIQLLRRLQLINDEGETTGFANIAVHLGVHEPGNLLFVYLLQVGAFHALHKTLHENETVYKQTVVNILAHLFTNRRLPVGYEPNGDSSIALPKMPEKFEEFVNKYNKDTEKLLLASLQAFFPSKLDNEYFRLSGKTSNLSLSESYVVSVFDDDLCLDPAFIPTVVELKDHRGRPILRNSYAYDFYLNGSKNTLITENKLDIGEIWYVIDDFNKMLKSLREVLAYSARVNDPVLLSITQISEEYERKFRHAFGMKTFT
ncbi:unnamed protein product [Bursaphelenchus xylophilus]|uniref:(pine wood nematode) hypothetical protein n=1 Tax=Bursaphelenchus xylophilus TaxID=6326 RepID=A0A1I7SQ22_BURXY|nr:unnamed protein product [Bursaphelenchus xylophilus]CAG9109511.1 unnamed protein product [Bursaphelenchus xylophilus]